MDLPEDMVDDNGLPPVIIDDIETWSKVPDALNFDPDISDRAVRVYSALYHHGRTASRCFPSDRRIAALIGGSHRSIPRRRRELAAKGWIRTYPRFVKGAQVSNGYALALDPAKAAEYAAEYVDEGDPPAQICAGPPAQDCAAPRADLRGAPAQICAGKEGDQINQIKRTRNTRESETRVSPLQLVDAPSDQAAPGRVNRDEAAKDELAVWYDGYPRKVARKAAERAFVKARKSAPLAEMVEGLERSKRAWTREGRAADKVPYPATWLNGECWTDEEPTGPATINGRPAIARPGPPPPPLVAAGAISRPNLSEDERKAIRANLEAHRARIRASRSEVTA